VWFLITVRADLELIGVKVNENYGISAQWIFMLRHAMYAFCVNNYFTYYNVVFEIRFTYSGDLFCIYFNAGLANA